MNCPNANDWDLLVMEVLEDGQSEPLLEHARACPTCRARFQAARRAHTDRVRMYEAFDRDHDSLREQMMAALPDELPQRTGAVRLVRGWARLGDFVMSLNNTAGRRAAAMLVPAACVVVAIVVLLNSSNGVAFAAVLERIRQARTMVCDVALSIHTELSEPFASEVEQDQSGAPMDIEAATHGKLSMYSDGVSRAWLLEQEDPPLRQLTLPDRLIMTQNGKNSMVKLTDDPDAPGYIESPETWLQHLLALADEPDRRLGRDVIDGQEVVGFEIAASRLHMGLGMLPDDSGSVVRLWVDVETHLPVRLQFDVVKHVGPAIWRLAGTWDHMRWDVPLDPQLFEPPPITEDDEIQDLHLPPATEETLIAGLRAYAEQSAELGSILASAEDLAAQSPERAAMLEQMRQWVHAATPYPTELDLQSMVLELSMRGALLRARLLSERAKRDPLPDPAAERARRDTEDADLVQQVDELTRLAGGAAMFYRKLQVDGREPEYFGGTVTPDDADQVLLRWKLDDGDVRVIYGDLRAETIPGSG